MESEFTEKEEYFRKQLRTKNIEIEHLQREINEIREEQLETIELKLQKTSMVSNVIVDPSQKTFYILYKSKMEKYLFNQPYKVITCKQLVPKGKDKQIVRH